jgi:hypothetical protein
MSYQKRQDRKRTATTRKHRRNETHCYKQNCHNRITLSQPDWRQETLVALLTMHKDAVSPHGGSRPAIGWLHNSELHGFRVVSGNLSSECKIRILPIYHTLYFISESFSTKVTKRKKLSCGPSALWTGTRTRYIYNFALTNSQINWTTLHHLAWLCRFSPW